MSCTLTAPREEPPTETKHLVRKHERPDFRHAALCLTKNGKSNIRKQANLKPTLPVMSTANKKTNKTFIKTKPTFFPMGFAVGQVVGDVVIVDFIDVLNGENAVIESIALPKEKAQQLSAALIEAIENGESED